MSFFAVLDGVEPDDRTDFTVTRLHLNLWCLAAIGFRRRTFVFDVGVEVTAGTTKVDKLVVALPFDTYRVESLSKKVLNLTTAAVIFDTVIDSISESQSTISYDDRTLHVTSVATKKAERDAQYSKPGLFTLFHLPLTEPIEPGETSYIRVRFPIVGTGTAWQWTRSHLRKTAAILDFRISDLRSSELLEGGSELIRRVRPIQSVAAFIMAPSWLHGRTIHPEPRYIRLLEARVWAQYLNRAPERLRRSRLVVYYWKNSAKKRVGDPATDPTPGIPDAASAESTATSSAAAATEANTNGEEAEPRSPERLTDITVQNPMRIYSDLTIDQRPSRAITALMSAVITAAVFALLFDVPDRQWVNDFLTWVADTANTWAGAITVVGIVAVLGAVSPFVPPLRWLWSTLRRGLVRAEQWFFQVLPWLGSRD
ncbi:hypothetical protein ASE16_02045 [Leifsonia sp. Root227]|uniref:hypothetical protein n=1 Tax=Leifsonia sp. Root227 TaxID=1736496 RepID=UPI0006F6161A|nr:hypothetical protein [Leifsonia sp. Root227]KRC51874.1 hypothetical protein ASE16_02045 [Leifsonia sp. Root227]